MVQNVLLVDLFLATAGQHGTVEHDGNGDTTPSEQARTHFKPRPRHARLGEKLFLLELVRESGTPLLS